MDNGKEHVNPGSKRPFRDLKTGETVYRFRGRAGFIPLDDDAETDTGGPYAETARARPAKNDNNGIRELIDIATTTLKSLELTLKQIGERYHG